MLQRTGGIKIKQPKKHSFLNDTPTLPDVHYNSFINGVNRNRVENNSYASITKENTLFIYGHGRNTGKVFPIPQEKKIITYTRFGDNNYTSSIHYLLGNIVGLTANKRPLIKEGALVFPKNIKNIKNIKNSDFVEETDRQSHSEQLDKLHIYNETADETKCDIFPDNELSFTFRYEIDIDIEDGDE